MDRETAKEIALLIGALVVLPLQRCVGGPCPYLLELPAWSINFIKFLGGFWSQYGVE